MKRVQLIELEDIDWFPSGWRDLLTDYMCHCNSLNQPYEPCVPLIVKVLDIISCDKILDLCSGGVGPWVGIYWQLARESHKTIIVTLSDKFPSQNASERVRRAGIATLHYLEVPVNALAVNEGNGCFRTLFTSFHHFRPEQAREILADALRNQVGIGIFEATERSFLGLVAQLGAPLVMLFVTPWIRPFSWKRLFWTYVVPIMPLCILWDGIVSCLRTYSVNELREMVLGLSANDYQWEVAQFSKRIGVKGTYLLGYPREK